MTWQNMNPFWIFYRPLKLRSARVGEVCAHTSDGCNLCLYRVGMYRDDTWHVIFGS